MYCGRETGLHVSSVYVYQLHIMIQVAIPNVLTNNTSKQIFEFRLVILVNDCIKNTT